jgi:hypothetical protein
MAVSYIYALYMPCIYGAVYMPCIYAIYMPCIYEAVYMESIRGNPSGACNGGMQREHRWDRQTVSSVVFSMGSYFYDRPNSLLLVIEPVLFTDLNICGRFGGKIGKLGWNCPKRKTLTVSVNNLFLTPL